MRLTTGRSRHETPRVHHVFTADLARPRRRANRMNRRNFITVLGGAAAAWPLAARAQKTAALIGFLISGATDSFAIFVEAFKQGMRDNGMVEGQDYVLDLRYADGDYSRFPALAAEVAQRKPAAIVVTTISAARAAQHASSTIPIVMTGLIDPVGQGLIASLARPGGNTTGLANLAQDVMPKLVEILRSTFPVLRDIAVLFNPANPANRELSKATPAQAGSIGVTVRLIEFTTAVNSVPPLRLLRASRPRPWSSCPTPPSMTCVSPFPRWHSSTDSPPSHTSRSLQMLAPLMSYGPPRRAMYHRTAEYVKKILTGAKPADLPVQQPTQLELSINLRTAKALGLTIPDTVLARTDRVIE